MNRLTQVAAVAVTVLASTASHAALKDFYSNNTGSGGNGSLAFFAVDKSAVASVTVDLGFRFNDATAAAFSAPGTVISWNFNNGSLTVNGAAQAGTYNWATPYAFFANAASSANTSWGVISGVAGAYPDFLLTTGNPTATQLANETVDLIGNMTLVSAMYGLSNGVVSNGSSRLSTQAAVGFGANAAVGETLAQNGWVANGAMMGANLNWQGNLTWTAGTAVGGTSPLWFLDDDQGAISKVSPTGLFSYNAGVLTWAVAAVPEVSTYAMFAAGLTALAFVRRRRA